MGWTTGILFLARAGNFSLHHHIQTISGAHPASYSIGTGSPSRVKQLGHEADHSPPFRAKVKNVWSCTSTLPFSFMVWCLIRKRICLYGMVLS
jgi:hypothetical protein